MLLFRPPALCILLTILVLAPPASASEVFSAYTLDGEAVRVSEFFEPGKATLVMLWTTYCKVCAEQFPIIEALHKDEKDARLKVIGLAVEGLAARDRVAAELRRRGTTFDSLVGEISELARSFEQATGETFHGTPTYLLFDRHGALAALINGPLKREAIEQYLAAQQP